MEIPVGALAKDGSNRSIFLLNYHLPKALKAQNVSNNIKNSVPSIEAAPLLRKPGDSVFVKKITRISRKQRSKLNR
jgi:hypothetical protein